MFSTVLRTLYGSLWKAAIPVLKHHKRLKIGFEERLVPKTWPSEDFISIQKNDSPCPTLWFQAASGGEATLLFPLIEALYEEYGRSHPNSPLPLFLCTTCTEQGMDIIRKQSAVLPQTLQERVRANFFPLDAPAIMRKAIQQTCPDLVVLLETELWPGLMHELTRADIPYCIVNARMTEKTFRSYQKAGSFFKHHRPRYIVATTVENALRFERVFHMEATVAPNIKFDIINRQLLEQKPQEPGAEYERMASLLTMPHSQIEPEKTPDQTNSQTRPHSVGQATSQPTVQATPQTVVQTAYKATGQATAQATSPATTQSMRQVASQATAQPAIRAVVPPLIALASVRQEEEEQLAAIVKMVCQHTVRQIPCLCLLAPRHLHRVAFWAQWLEKSEIPFVRKSQLHHIPTDTRCILWDTFGELNILYALADVAFVGGSLAPLGGQNFLEPLSQGTATVIGPSWSNFAWVGKELFTEGLITEQGTALEVGRTLLHKTNSLLASSIPQWGHDRATAKTTVRSKLGDIISHNTGGSRITAEILSTLL